MARWMHGYRKLPAIRGVFSALSIHSVTHRLPESSFEWSTLSELSTSQRQDRGSVPPACKTNALGLLPLDGAAWILTDCADLKIRLLTIAHAGEVGHRGADSTWHDLRVHFSWSDQRADVGAFVSNCLLYVQSKSG